MKKKRDLRLWSLVWGLGIAGQLCWNIENQWFNTFVYAKIAKDPTIISWMVAVSALATALSTFIFGTLSDRMGRRKPFIVGGYLLWGLFTIGFGATEQLTGNGQTLLLAAVAAVAADALMSFFGSMGNDSGFNAWINDAMTTQNSGALGAALATQPIFGTIAGTVLGGLLIGGEDNYQRLFWSMGGLVIISAGLAQTFMKEAPGLTPHRDGSFIKQLLSAFNIRSLTKRKELVWVFLTLTVYFISFNVYFPHVGNYMLYYLGFDAGSMGLMEGMALLLGMVSVLPASSMLRRERYAFAAGIAVVLSFLGVGILGLWGRPEYVDPTTLFNWSLLGGLLLFGCGYIMFMQVLPVWMKQLFPQESKGQFEGFRILFFVLIPWLVSPLIANPIIKGNGEVLDSNGFAAYLPTHVLFLIGAGLILLTFVPLFFAARCRKQKGTIA